MEAQDDGAAYRSSALRISPVGLVLQGVHDVVSRRQLIRYLVQADLKKKGSDTLLGNIWWIFDPLLQMAVYVVLVSVIFNRPQPAYPLFVFAAVLPWKWFQATVQDATQSVVSAEKLIKQIHFPKLVLPPAPGGGVPGQARRAATRPLFAVLRRQEELVPEETAERPVG